VPALATIRRLGIDARLVVARDRPERPAIEAHAREVLPRNVLMLGHMQDRASLAAMLASADVFLHPNPAEPFGLGPLEAMASGTAVVVPNAGGVLSYASAQNAWLAEPSASGLGIAAANALRQRHARRRRAEAALETARQFNWADACSKFFETCEELHDTRLTRWAPSPLHAVPCTRTQV
jgi:alpha-1,6-mannosyltransferase